MYIVCEEMKLHGHEMLQIVSHGLCSPDLAANTIVLVCEAVQAVQGKLQGVDAVLLEGALLQIADAASLSQALQALIVLAQHHPTFFKARFQPWIDMMLKMASSSAFDSSIRLLSFEWVATLTASSKGLATAIPDLSSRVLSVAFTFLEDVQSDLHEEGEAKVNFFLRKLPCQDFLPLVQNFAESKHPAQRLAAATAMRAASEHLNEVFVEILLRLSYDEQKAVRSRSYLALGQICHDGGAEILKQRIPEVLTALLRGCEEELVPAIEALEALFHEISAQELCDPEICLSSLLRRLGSSNEVLVAALGAIGALAMALGEGFDMIFDSLMPILLRLCGSSSCSSEAFQCVSCVGFALSPENFRKAASAALRYLPQTWPGSDVLRDGVGRMAKLLKSDFDINFIMPSLLEALSLEVLDQEDLELNLQVTGELTEAVMVVKLLELLARETCFEAYHDETMSCLQKIFKMPCKDLAYELRSAAYLCWAQLVFLKPDTPLPPLDAAAAPALALLLERRPELSWAREDAAAEITRSLERSLQVQNEEDFEEEDFEDEDFDDEDECRVALLSIITTSMKADPDNFLSWPTLPVLMRQWFGAGHAGRSLALRLAAEISQLGERAVHLWPCFMEQVMAVPQRPSVIYLKCLQINNIVRNQLLDIKPTMKELKVS